MGFGISPCLKFGYKSTTNRNTEKKTFRLKSGLTNLNMELYKYGYITSPLCPCGLDEETIQHVLLDCPQYIEARESTVTSIEKGYRNTNTEPHLRCLNIDTLIGSNPGIPPKMKSLVNHAQLTSSKPYPAPSKNSVSQSQCTYLHKCIYAVNMFF